METAYLETTIISYLASEPSRDLIVAGHQQITHEWWAQRRSLFACSISQVVLDEISQGDPVQAARRLVIARVLPKLTVSSEAEGLTLQLLRSGALPATAASDAAHIAIAATAAMDYLLTWNCRHIANGQILKRVATVCEQAGYRLPAVCTPEELMGDETNVEDPIVAEVRRVRDALARRFNYDVHAMFEDLRKREGQTVTGDELRAGVEGVSSTASERQAAVPDRVGETIKE